MAEEPPKRRMVRPPTGGLEGGRGKPARLKTAKERTPSQQAWLERQINDPFAAKARALGYRSRAAFKISSCWVTLAPDLRNTSATSGPASSLHCSAGPARRSRAAGRPRPHRTRPHPPQPHPTGPDRTGQLRRLWFAGGGGWSLLFHEGLLPLRRGKQGKGPRPWT